MKHDYDMILLRLTVILQKLYEGEELSVSVLAKEFNVSVRTIQRDFNERLVRLPIEKVGRRWKMRDGIRIERMRKPEEIVVLDLLETLSYGIGGDFAVLAASLLGKLKNSRTAAVIDSRTVIEDLMDHHRLFLQIEKAIEEQKIVFFAYRGRVRTVKPCWIVSFEGYWYLYGVESGRLKTFYLKSIGALSTGDVAPACPPHAEAVLKRAVNVWFEPDREPFEVIIHATAKVAKYFERRPIAPTQRIARKYSDGSIDLVFDATSDREVLHEVKKWIPDLCVDSPHRLAVKAVEMARQFALLQEKAVDDDEKI